MYVKTLTHQTSASNTRRFWTWPGKSWCDAQAR